jgi:signal transduction histidine kinase
MTREHTRLVSVVFHLCWVIPLVVSLMGAGTVLFERAVFEERALSVPHVIGSILLLGLVGSVLVWLMLTWATNAALAEAEARRELASRNRVLVILNVIAETASQTLDLEEVLRITLEKVVELMGLQTAGIWLVEEERLVLRAHYGMTSDFATSESVMQSGRCPCGRYALTGEALVIDNLAVEPYLAGSACAREGFQSILSVPMKAKGRVLGVIHTASRQRSAFSQEDLQILTTVGDRVAMIIETTQLYEQARRRALHLETASLVGQRMAALLDLDALLTEIVNLIREKFGYNRVHILLVDGEVKEVILKEASGSSADEIKRRGLRLKVGEESIVGWVADTGQLLLCNDVSQEPRYCAEELLPETKAELAVPLLAGDKIIGVLDVQCDRRDAFDNEDVTVLRILGNQVGITIENARLFQETRHRYDAMVALHETSLDIISQLDRAELLKALLRRGVHLLEAEGASLSLYDAKRGLVHNAANYNTWRDWAGVTLRAGEGVVGHVILTGKPVIVNDHTNWPRRAEVFAGSPHTRILGAPLKWQDQIIGGIVVLNGSQAQPFDHEDLWLLSLFADLATIAIKNAELHTQVREFNQALERQVEERTQELSRAEKEIAAKAEQLRSLLAKTIRIQEEERARIARDMHDGVVQLITAVRYELQATKVAVGSGSTEAAHEKLHAAREMLEEMEREIRGAIYDLHPPMLDTVGLIPALEKYVSGFRDLSGIACHVQVAGVPCQLPPSTEVAIFRMVEEALHNVAAHAEAGTACVIVDFRPAMLYITVQDDGRGFNYQLWADSRDGKHLGLVGTQERVESLGGKMEVRSKPGHGTRVMFRLPVQRDGGQLGSL